MSNGVGIFRKRVRERKMIGNDCISNPPLLNVSGGVGHVTNIAGVNSYVTGSPLALLAIVLVSDIYGIPSSKYLPHFYCLLIYQQIEKEMLETETI